MLAQPFMTVQEFDEVVARGNRMETRLVAAEIEARWFWLCNGYVGLPMHEDSDLVDGARRWIGAAAGMPVPQFPLSPRDYRITFGKWLAMMPAGLRAEYESEDFPYPLPDENQVVFWGQGALGGVPEVYRGPQSGTRMPGTFYDLADRTAGGPGYDFNKFETWLLQVEALVYNGVKISEEPAIWSAGDPVADRMIRALYAGYSLDRSKGRFQREIVWQATHLPTPVLTWHLRYWIRTCESGLWEQWYAKPENRERRINEGLVAVAAEGGWIEWPDPMATMVDWHFSLVNERGTPGATFSYMFPGILGSTDPEVSDIQFNSAAHYLGRFGFKVRPVVFGELPE